MCVCAQASIITSMRPLAQVAGEPQTKVALYSYFVKRIKQFIHLSICMSPLGEAFRTRLRNFPSLVNNCTIDYFAEWPEEALRSVAKSTLDTIEMGSDAIQEGIVQMCGEIHQSVEVSSKQYLDEQRRYNYVTPTSYLEVLSTFKTLLTQERDRVSTAKRRLVIGGRPYYHTAISKRLPNPNPNPNPSSHLKTHPKPNLNCMPDPKLTKA